VPPKAVYPLGEQFEAHLAADAVRSGNRGEGDLIVQGLFGLLGAFGGSSFFAALGGLAGRLALVRSLVGRSGLAVAGAALGRFGGGSLFGSSFLGGSGFLDRRSVFGRSRSFLSRGSLFLDGSRFLSRSSNLLLGGGGSFLGGSGLFLGRSFLSGRFGGGLLNRLGGDLDGLLLGGGGGGFGRLGGVSLAGGTLLGALLRLLARLALVRVVAGRRSLTPATSRKRATRSDGWAPTESQWRARSASSFTRSGLSLGSIGS
jgi:hypothetical protein